MRLFRICLKHCFGSRPKVAAEYENWVSILKSYVFKNLRSLCRIFTVPGCCGLCENVHFFFSTTPGFPVNVTLSIVREQGSSGEVRIHFQTRPALYQPPSNQATEDQDYTPRDSSILMINGATVALVTLTILPVREKKRK